MEHFPFLSNSPDAKGILPLSVSLVKDSCDKPGVNTNESLQGIHSFQLENSGLLL